jgi:hypothetical protein
MRESANPTAVAAIKIMASATANFRHVVSPMSLP